MTCEKQKYIVHCLALLGKYCYEEQEKHKNKRGGKEIEGNTRKNMNITNWENYKHEKNAKNIKQRKYLTMRNTFFAFYSLFSISLTFEKKYCFHNFLSTMYTGKRSL